MDIARGEEGYDFGENIVDECENAVVAGAEHVVRDAPHGPHLIGPSRTPEMGVGGKCGLHVAGKVYLGYDGDVSVGGIVDHFLDLLLSVEAAVRCAVILAWIASDDSLLASGAYFGEQGIFFNLHAPSLVVGKMPVETVHVVECHHVDVAFGLVDREEVARDVEVYTSIVKAGRVVDLDGGQHRDTAGHNRQGFTQGL